MFWINWDVLSIMDFGTGGETIKQINQQSGAHCELDRRSNSNQTEKTFTIKGDPEAIETAKRIISDKIQMPINFINLSGGATGMSSNMPTVSTAYFFI